MKLFPLLANTTITFVFLSALPCFSQAPLQTARQPQHSINIHYGFNYAADVELDEDRKQRIPGIGYQYTNKRNWYIGADFQYDRNKRADYFLDPMSTDGFYTYLSQKIPGGTGYFTAVNSLAANYSIITSDSIFKTPVDKYPVTKRLQSERYNLYLHGGKRWEKSKSRLEAGITLHGTFFRSFTAINNAKELPVPVTEKSTGSTFEYLDGIRYTERVEKSRFVPGAGLHIRYNYQLAPSWQIGLQGVASAGVEGLFLQAAPKLVYSFKSR